MVFVDAKMHMRVYVHTYMRVRRAHVAYTYTCIRPHTYACIHAYSYIAADLRLKEGRSETSAPPLQGHNSLHPSRFFPRPIALHHFVSVSPCPPTAFPNTSGPLWHPPSAPCPRKCIPASCVCPTSITLRSTRFRQHDLAASLSLDLALTHEWKINAQEAACKSMCTMIKERLR